MRRPSSLVLAAIALCLAASTTAMAAPKPPAGGSTAPAQVFAPNPVADLGIQTLTDQKDADYFSADPRSRGLPPRDADRPRRLAARSPAPTPRSSARREGRRRNTGSGFIYTRDQDQFEQVMGYYWVTQAQRYIQSLGFGSTLPAVNKRQQLLRINQFGGDNSFYRDGTSKLTITLGKGGVDDAEDAEVIVHEYGHSVQDDQVPGFGSLAGGGRDRRGASATTWPSRSPRHCAPTADEPAWPTGTRPPTRDRRRTACAASTAPSTTREDVEGEVHADGEIWSRALWDIRRRSAPRLADTVIIAAQFGFTPDDLDAGRRGRTTIATARPVPKDVPDGTRSQRGVRGARARVARARAVAAARTAGAGGEDQRDHGRQRYRPARVRTQPSAADSGMSGRMLDFLAYLEFERGLSRNTLEAYRSDLLQFGAWLEPTRRRRARRRARRPRAGSWPSWRRAARSAPPVAPATLQRKVACLRSFYRHLRREGVLDRRPDRRPARPAQSRRLPAGAHAATRSPGCSRSPTRHRARRAARPRAARADVRLRAARLGGDRPRGRATSTSRPASCAPAARAPRSASCPIGSRGGARARAPTSSAAGPSSSATGSRRGCSSTTAAAGSPARASTRSSSATRRAAGPRGPDEPAHAAPHVRDPPARRRLRPALAAGDARPRRHRDHAALHAPLGRAPEGRLLRRAPARQVGEPTRQNRGA